MRADLAGDLRALGVRPGMTLLVHASLSALGWVCGGAPTATLALGDVLGAAGTLVMPSHSSQCSDPMEWTEPAVPAAWWARIRADMSAYDPRRTPSRGMGRIAECFRTLPGVLRSAHPQLSFAALGPRAAAITATHALADGLGEQSPLAVLYALDARICLLGTGYDSCTALHLAEHRAGPSATGRQLCGAPIIDDRRRVWRRFSCLDYDSNDFDAIGRDYEAADSSWRCADVGHARSTLIALRALVDFGALWMARHRPR